MFVSALLLLASLGTGEIEVHEKVTGCRRLHEEERYAWHWDGERYVNGSRSLTRERLHEIRATVLAAPEEIANLLASVGITPSHVAAKRDTILATASRFWGNTLALASPDEELDALLSFQSVAPHMESKLLHAHDMRRVRFEVTLPGDPPVHVKSDGRAPWMLPWTVTAGERTWETPDVRVSQAMLELANPDGPCKGLLDGHDYWTKRVWEDGFIWGLLLEQLLQIDEQLYADLPGFGETEKLFRIDDATSRGDVIDFRLSPRVPVRIDRVTWSVPIVNRGPALGWDVLLRIFGDAEDAVEPHAWLVGWKRAKADREIVLVAQGELGYADVWRHPEVTLAWQHEGLVGGPDYQIALREGNKLRGTVYVSLEEPYALVVIARRDPSGTHWFDRLDLSYSVRKPTYAVVEPGGRYKIR